MVFDKIKLWYNSREERKEINQEAKDRKKALDDPESEERKKIRIEIEEEKRKEEGKETKIRKLRWNWLPTLDIFPGTTEQYSDDYYPVESIPLKGKNKGVGIEISRDGNYFLISSTPIEELKELGLVAIVQANMTKIEGGGSLFPGYSAVACYGLPVKKRNLDKK